jgi:hypothetical protein
MDNRYILILIFFGRIQKNMMQFGSYFLDAAMAMLVQKAL